ncbi:MAG: hypothetical protein ACFCAD_01385 [Pleurocapsa sp.]
MLLGEAIALNIWLSAISVNLIDFMTLGLVIDVTELSLIVWILNL